MASKKHARLSASGSCRWVNCPPSLKLEEKYGKRTESVFMAEGTLAHDFAEVYARMVVLREGCTGRLSTLRKHKLYAEEMEDYARDYAEFILSDVIEDEYNSFENRVYFSDWVDVEAFGTCDHYGVNASRIRVTDYKYGKGVEVSAADNTQMMLYALGVYAENELLYDFTPSTEIVMTIYQPRIGKISSHSITLAFLKEWAETTLKTSANLALEGGGSQCAGSHCRFCSVKDRCKTFADYNLELVKYDFADESLLTNDQIADILTRLPTLTSWANAISEFALKEALQGAKFSGFKLVEGRSIRTWVDTKEVARKLLESYEEDKVYKKSLIGIGDAEKLVGKKNFGTVFEGLFTKPKGKPTLVGTDDKRPEWVDDAAEDFETE